MHDNTDHPLGTLIAREEDALGPVCVYQRGSMRYLTFGNAVEQSCLNLDQPQTLQHVYTQAMLLGPVLLPDAANTLLLGLGGGSLVRALRQIRARMRIDAVEHRQAVIDLARSHFLLDEDARLRLHCAEGEQFVRDSEGEYDLLMLDLYLAEGAHPAQTQEAFLHACADRLSERGILLANQWCSEYRDSQRAQAAMRDVFGERLLYLQVQGGNTIAVGFKGELPDLNRNRLFEQAQAYGLALQIPLQKLVRNFWRQNAALLQSGRWRR